VKFFVVKYQKASLDTPQERDWVCARKGIPSVCPAEKRWTHYKKRQFTFCLWYWGTYKSRTCSLLHLWQV